MKCPLCNTEISVESNLVGPYKVYQPSIKGTDESGEIEICGQCFLLVNILQTMKEVKECLTSMI